MAKFSFLPPVGVTVGDYDNYKYNLVAIHIRYFRSAFDSFMKPGTKYITILRDPATQFESAFVAFEYWKSLPRKQQIVPMRERLEYFFLNPDYNREKFKQVVWPLTNRLGTGWYYAKNDQIFDLGLDHKYHDNKSTVKQYINRLDDELDLVLILEHIDESLVILRKVLCWSWNDILYMAKNARAHVEPLSHTLAGKIREWNSVDVLLYSYFNQTLWNKIANYGSSLSFQSDLELFRKMLKQVNEQCESSTSPYKGKLIQNVAKGASTDCKRLATGNYKMLKDIIHRQSQGRQRPRRI
ncbi:galactosylceramide sulfotransferase-like [Anneissia japonica]|uniref:galactosylceramide sulfotransferase-like n=1 Tax=Anneissia japonica TaxID=1529436 RepID=UPI0014254C77|nr:galactosylceramide sulfotransferase-like [Anneissia japonica]